MDSLGVLQNPGFSRFDPVRRSVEPSRPKVTEGAQRAPAVVLGGALACAGGVSQVDAAGALGLSRTVTPTPPVKPVVYRRGAMVDLSV
ncbi:hypothetical protein [Phenylobacterium sp.]|jgi:hypothetical protein|uniref:hypothetical protein n=1 Tax=Phenylobacterium sp. TaxID=1871053 RepID=UPI002F3FE369